MKLLNLSNLVIFLSSLLIISIGVLVIFSSSKDLAFQQFLYGGVGLLLFLFISQIDLHAIKKLIKPFYFFIIFLLVTVYILGVETRGSLRWIPLGFINVQPSEFAKISLILLLSLFWNDHYPSWRNILKSVFWALPFLLLVFKQPDLGSALTLGAIWLGMLFASQISLKKIIVLIIIAAISIPSSWAFLHDYQKQRVTSFLQPGLDPLGQGYNLIQSTIAVGAGELFGMGLGRGTQSRLQFLPEFRTDFIFASIAEEMGFFGSLIILSLYLFLLGYCLNLASKTDDKFYYSIIIGVFSMLLFQIFVNIGMNIGLLPITGITLPLISYGGSSLIATLICLGMVASVAKSKRTFDTEVL
jgi:rod shape determining protein RodA